VITFAAQGPRRVLTGDAFDWRLRVLADDIFDKGPMVLAGADFDTGISAVMFVFGAETTIFSPVQPVLFLLIFI
jgi:hypothetical protein